MDGWDALYSFQDYEDKLIRWQLRDWWDADLIYEAKPNPNKKETKNDMNIQERYPAKLVRGQDLTTPIVALITAVKDEELVAGKGKKPEMVLCVYFENVTSGKPQRMKTNAYTPGLGHAFNGRKLLAQQIAELLGEWDTDNWVGKRIELYQVDNTAGGKRVKSIAARLPVDKPASKNGKAPATLDERKAGLVAWYDAGNRINADNAAATDKSVKEIAAAIGYMFNLEAGHDNPSGRLAALVEHLKQPAPEPAQ
jgi:hypothetical protein